MPSYLPTTIQQIGQLPTSDAALLSQVYNGPKVNTDDILKLLDATLGKVNRGKQERRYASAIDAATRALQAGMSYNDAVTGLPSDITGSDEFREAILGRVTGDVRYNSDLNRQWSDSLQNQKKSEADIERLRVLNAQTRAEMRRNQMMEEALGIKAQVQRMLKETRSSDASHIYEMLREKGYVPGKNPYADNEVIDLMVKGNYTLNGSPTSGISLSLTTPRGVNKIINEDWISPEIIKDVDEWAKQWEYMSQSQLRFLNPAMLRYIKGEYSGQTIDDRAKVYATSSGEYGKKGTLKDFNDVRESVQDAYNSLVPLAQKYKIPEEFIWALMDQHITSPSTPWTQIGFDLDAIKDDMKGFAGNFNETVESNKNTLLAQQMYSTMRERLLDFDKRYKKLMPEYNTQLREGKINRKTYEHLVGTLQKEFKDITDTARYKH